MSKRDKPTVDLKQFRKTNGLYQKDVAEYLGVTIGFISAVERGVAYSNIADLSLTEGKSGNIVRFSNVPRNWREDRDYLFPIPTDDIVLTNGAVTQNPNWE